MTIWFENAAKISNVTDEQEIKAIVDENTSLFGYLQPLCVLWSIPIGYVLDRKFADSKENPKKLAEAASNRDDGIPLLSENDRKTEKEVETTNSSHGGRFYFKNFDQKSQKKNSAAENYFRLLVSARI
jgi:hypothetical protein